KGLRVARGTLGPPDGATRHAASGRAIPYEQLAEKAAWLPSPQKPELKKPEQFKYIGKPMGRLDATAKSTGTAGFGIDVKIPDLRIGYIARPPSFGGTGKSVDDTGAKASPGVENIVNLGTGVGVIASTYWHAKTAAEKLKIVWDEPKAAVSSESIRDMWSKEVAAGGGRVGHKVADAEGALAGAAKKLHAGYA